MNTFSETEMRNFFEGVVTSFVGLSEQAQELVKLRQDFNDLVNKVDTQAQENERLHKSAQDAWNLVAMLEQEKAEQRNKIVDQEQKITDQNNQIATYDSEMSAARNRILEVEASFSNTAVTLNELRASYADAQDRITALSTEVNSLTYQLSQSKQETEYVKAERDRAVSEVHDSQNTITILSADLTEANNKLKHIREALEASTAIASNVVNF